MSTAGSSRGEAIAEVAHRLKRSYVEVGRGCDFLQPLQHRPLPREAQARTLYVPRVPREWRLGSSADYIVRKLGVRHGETTADGMFTFEEVECLNACDRAPVMQVGDQYYVAPSDDDKDGSDHREASKKTEESTVIQYADAVVAVHLRDTERAGR